MSLYFIHWDGEDYYLEAATMANAIRKFQEEVAGAEDPELCSVVTDGDVIR
jgi:hypothetical protein